MEANPPWAETWGRLRGRYPQNLTWGRSIHPSPNISRNSVIKKGVMKEFLTEIEVFCEGKGDIHVCYVSDFRKFLR